MDVNRLTRGQQIAAVAGALLFIDLFLDWYGAGNDTFSVSASAWQVFSFTDLLCAATAIVAVGVAVQAMGALNIPVRLSQVLLPLAAVTTLVVLYRLINQPGDNDIVNNEFGAYLGFVLAAITTYGAFRAQDEEPPAEHDARPGAGSTPPASTTPASATGAPAPDAPAAPVPPPTATPGTPSPGAPTTTPGATPPAGATSDDPPPPPPASTRP